MHNGFSLLEIVVAVAVLIVALLAISGGVRVAYTSAVKAGEKVQAAFFLEDAAEAIRYLRDITWGDTLALATNGTSYCLDGAKGDYILNNPSGNMLLIHMDENAVTAGRAIMDSSGQKNNGVYDAGTSDTAIKTVAGSDYPIGSGSRSRFLNALNFDGGDDRVEVPHASSLNFTNQFTLEAWVKPTPLNPNNYWYTILSKGASGSPGYYFWIINGKLYAYLALSPPVTVGALNTLIVNPNTWNHVAVTYDSSVNKIRFYVNGVKEAVDSSGSGLLASVSSKFWVGSQNSGGDANPIPFFTFNGYIDEVAIFNRALSTQEIMDHYTGGPVCHRLDSMFDRRVTFATVCRDNSGAQPPSAADNVIGFNTGSGCASGAEDTSMKKASVVVSWKTFSESLELYIADLFRN